MVVLTVSGIIETFFPGGLNDIKFDMVDVMAAITCAEQKLICCHRALLGHNGLHISVFQYDVLYIKL